MVRGMNDPVGSGMGKPGEGMEELLAALNTCHECREKVGQAECDRRMVRLPAYSYAPGGGKGGFGSHF